MKSLRPLLFVALIALVPSFAEAAAKVSGRYAVTASPLSNICGGTTSCAGPSLPGGSVAVTGNDIVVAYYMESISASSEPASVTDASGCTYARVGTVKRDFLGIMDIWRCRVTANNAGQSIVVTISNTATDVGFIAAWEFSGLLASQAGALDASQSQFPATSFSSTAITPTNTTGVHICFISRSSGTYTDDSNFTYETIIGGNEKYVLGYWVNPPASSTACTHSSTGGNEDAQTKITWLVGAAGAGGNAPRAMHYKRMQAQRAANDDDFLLRASR